MPQDSAPDQLFWRPLRRLRPNDRAERANVPGGELVTFDILADPHGPRLVAWQIYGGPRHQDLITTAEAENFEAAKAAAEREWRSLARRAHAAGQDLITVLEHAPETPAGPGNGTE